MKQNTIVGILIGAIVVLAALLVLQRCKNETPAKLVHFEGIIVDGLGRGIDGAQVSIGKNSSTTDPIGRFTIDVPDAKRFVLNTSMRGYAFRSKVVYGPLTNIEIIMPKVFPSVVDPKMDNVIVEKNPGFTRPVTNPIRPLSPLDTLPFVYNAEGQLISFKMPPELISAYRANTKAIDKRVRATVSIPAGGLLLNGKVPAGKVEVVVSTENPASAQSSIGDDSVQTKKGQERLVPASHGLSIEAYYNGELLKLDSTKRATITFPIENYALANPDSLATQLPLLTYVEEYGFWKQEGTARLNSEKNAYVGEVNHFSSFSLGGGDGGDACIRIHDEGCDYCQVRQLEVVTSYQYGSRRLFDIKETDCGDLHAIRRVPRNTTVGIKLIVNGFVKSTYVLSTGSTRGEGRRCPYNECLPTMSPLELRETECWMSTSVVGTMKGPVLAVSRTSSTAFRFSWIYLSESMVAGASTNPANTRYKFQYWEVSNEPTFDPFTDDVTQLPNDDPLTPGTIEGWKNFDLTSSYATPAFLTDRPMSSVTPLTFANPLLIRILVAEGPDATGTEWRWGKMVMLNTPNPAFPNFGSYYDGLGCSYMGNVAFIQP